MNEQLTTLKLFFEMKQKRILYNLLFKREDNPKNFKNVFF